MVEQDGYLLDRWNSHGDSQSFMEIVARYQGMVYGVCLRILRDHGKAEDLVQECFLKLTRARSRTIDMLGPWLHRVAINESLNRLRSDSRRAIREKRYMSDFGSANKAQWDDINEILDVELDKLTDEHRTVIVSHYLEGNTQVEVAGMLGVPRTTVNSRIKAGLDMLQRNLKARGISVPVTALGTMMLSEITHAAPAVLANTMGKAVLRGAYQPTPTLWPVLSKVIGGLTFATVCLVAYFLLTPSALTPGALDNTPDSLQAADPGPDWSVNPDPSDALLASIESPELVETIPETQSPPPTPVEPTLEPERIRLQCLDEEGNPVEGATVYVYQKYDRTLEHFLVASEGAEHLADGPLLSDHEGYIEFKGLVGPLTATLRRFAYGVVDGTLVGIWKDVDHPGIPIPEREPILELVPSRTLKGQVLLPEGYDVGTVDVALQQIHIGPSSGRYTNIFGKVFIENDDVFSDLFDVAVDSRGQFEIRNVPRNGTLRVGAVGSGLGGTVSSFIKTDVTDFLELNLKAHGVIEGSVRWSDNGVPVTDRRVYARTRTNGSIGGPHIGVTDSRGNYRIEGLGEGSYYVRVEPDVFPITHIARTRSEVPVYSGEITEVIDFELETGRIVTGRATEKGTEKGIEGVLITTNSHSEAIDVTLTDKNGDYALRVPLGSTNFQVRGVPDGIQHPGSLWNSVNVTAQTKEIRPINIKLDADSERLTKIDVGSVTGRVLSGNGVPVGDLQIYLDSRTENRRSRTRGGTLGQKYGKTESNGKFIVDIEITGQADHLVQTRAITVGGGEWSAFVTDWFEIEDGESRDLGDIYLVPLELELSALVVDEDGAIVPGVTYSVTAEEYFNPSMRMRSDTSGVIYLSNLPETEITMKLHRFGYERKEWKGFAGSHLEIVLKKE